MKDLLQIAAENPIIPVVKIANPENAPDVARALYEGGIRCMEITFRTHSAAQAIEKVVESCPDMLVGAGTIVCAEQVDQAVNSGAKFIVSPGLSEQVVLRCKEREIPCLPGCVTAGEIMKAQELGLKLVKFFPAETSGGINAIKALSAPFPDIKFIPTGGINMSNVVEYLGLPCVAACGGSWMVSETDINNRDFLEIMRKTRLAAEAVKRR